MAHETHSSAIQGIRKIELKYLNDFTKNNVAFCLRLLVGDVRYLLFLYLIIVALIQVLRQNGTEPPGSGEYNKSKDKGVYKCAACDAPLYTSETKVYFLKTPLSAIVFYLADIGISTTKRILGTDVWAFHSLTVIVAGQPSLRLFLVL